MWVQTMTQEAPEQQTGEPGQMPGAETAASNNPVSSNNPASPINPSDKYADFWMRGLSAVLEALVFMAISIPVSFGLPLLITRVDASMVLPELPGFFFLEGFAPSVAFPLFLMKLSQHFTSQAIIGPTGDTTLIWALVIGGLVLSDLLYHVLMESSPLQGTIGKVVIGMKVTRVDGSRPSIFNALVRHIARLLSMLPVFGGYLMILKNDKKQALHDKISGCVVVKDAVEPVIPKL
ncbi:MAG: RDD family protein [Candidatus Melainabacteria bacterium]|nr:RDD family protein [Candidatus Melainabacteria bacterium]